LLKEKSFLQSIKLEISRSFKLEPYERMSFHKILGMLKSDTGMEILLKELDKGPDVRSSAISILVKFQRPEVINALAPLLKSDLSPIEKILIFSHIRDIGNEENIQDIIDYIDAKREDPEELPVLTTAFEALKSISGESDDVLNYLLSIVTGEEADTEIKALAIIALSKFKATPTFEKILKEGDDRLCYAVYRAIYDLNRKLTDETIERGTDESALFTYSDEVEDKILLDIRVLLGKFSSKFDLYSVKTKVAFICGMISCNHREYLIYTMKALTSSDRTLVIMTLYALFININRVRDPDKLFRNLISLTTEHQVENELIITIFTRFFSQGRISRQYNILKDKLYSYIVVTLEAYFETFRKEFMITDVSEKSLPESFQKIRVFILEKLNPEYKRKILTFLNHDDSSAIRNIVREIGDYVKHLDQDDEEVLNHLVEVLYDSDKKSRENSATRIEDLNFEKRYLRDRIVRLCEIISSLHINDASSTLVNIYNYLKKYPDPEITDKTIYTLSVLNYSYMLGEIEVLLTTGDDSEKYKSLQLISLFTEQRSLNVLLEFIHNNITAESEILELAINILIEKDIVGNATANQVLKKIISITKNLNILRIGILGVGRCGLESDVDYLHELFFTITDNDTKNHVVRAIGSITTISQDFEKRKVIKHLSEYLKEPGIRIRVYSCLLLVKLGNKEALKSIRDMLIIKNKSIQREILTILGDLKSVEFSFFLVSLLKEEYGITDDIISVLEMLPEEDLKEVDSFIVNIFRKYEAPDLGDIETKAEQDVIEVNNLKKRNVTLLNIDISYEEDINKIDISELISMNLKINSLMVQDILDNKGIISRMSSRSIVAIFDEPIPAIKTSLTIKDNINTFAKSRSVSNFFNTKMQIISNEVSLLNDELVYLPSLSTDALNSQVLNNRIILDQNSHNIVENIFAVNPVSELLYTGYSSGYKHFEVINPINFHEIANNQIEEKITEVEEKIELDSQIEQELKKLRLKTTTTSSVSIAGDLEDIGLKLGKQLKEIEMYVQKRSTDRELIQNVKKMLNNTHNLYKVEISRLRIE
jgi:HEAT repeat protein